MGKSRPDDPYNLTTRPAWPEVDEDVLRESASAFDSVANTVGEKISSAKGERSELFGGGVKLWSGGAASDAANSVLGKRIADLESVKQRLDASAQLFRNSASATSSAKEEITNRTELATDILNWVRDHDDIPQDAKDRAIEEGVRRHPC